MKIVEFKIDSYGPVSYDYKFLLKDFNLFFGNNEVGKSLTIDALIKFLVNKEKKIFAKIDRVGEYPSGYLRIKSAGGNVKFPARGGIFKYLGKDISADMFGNIFVVRASDLQIRDEQGFFIEVTEKMSDLKTGIIDDLKENIIELSNLTRKNFEFQNKGETRLKERVESGKKIIHEIEKMIKDLKEKDYDNLVLREIELDSKIDELQNSIQALEIAEKRLRYERISKLVKEINSVKEKLGEYEKIDEEGRQRWFEILSEKEKIKIDTERIERQIDVISKKLEDLKRELRQKEIINDSLKDKWEKVFDIKNKKEKRLRNLSIVIENSEKLKNYLFQLGGSLILFLISIILYSSQQGIFFLLIGILSLLSFVFFMFYPRIRVNRAKRRWKEITSQLASLSVVYNGYSYEGLCEKIGEFEDSYKRVREEYDMLISEIRRYEDRLKDLKEQVNQRMARLEELDNESLRMQDYSSAATYDVFKNLLKEKMDLEERLKSNMAELSGIVGFKVNNVEDVKDVLVELGKFKDEAPGIEFDEKKLNNLKNELQKLNEEHSKVVETFKIEKERLSEIEKRINDILREEDVRCFTVAGLELAKQKIEDFIRDLESKRKNALVAIRILDEILVKRKEEITTLFGKDKYVSRIFRDITGGKYTEVVYDSENGILKLVNEDEEVITADLLSSGAFDQLYFSVRLAFANALLPDGGFFILDDPFIRSDSGRLKRQIDLLFDISRKGWQILYFSAKDEVREVLKEKIDSGDVGYFELSG